MGKWVKRMRSEISKGDIVIHPAHGASEVVGIERKKLAGKKRRFLVLKPIMLDMTVYIPADNADHAGLRQPVKREHFTEVIKVLKQKEGKPLITGSEGLGPTIARFRAAIFVR